MTYYITGMVSISCKTIVAQELTGVGLYCKTMDNGFIELESVIPEAQLQALKASLIAHGMRLLEDPKEELLQRIKNVVNEMMASDQSLTVNFSIHLSGILLYDYTYLANLFSEKEGITLEQYIIRCRIAKSKELLHHSSAKETAFALHYSSAAHFSAQFKKITGMTPTQYKQTYASFIMKPVNNISNYQNRITA